MPRNAMPESEYLAVLEGRKPRRIRGVTENVLEILTDLFQIPDISRAREQRQKDIAFVQKKFKEAREMGKLKPSQPILRGGLTTSYPGAERTGELVNRIDRMINPPVDIMPGPMAVTLLPRTAVTASKVAPQITKAEEILNWRPRATPELDAIINARDALYHATSGYRLEEILKSGALKPMKEAPKYPKYYFTGVSTSRVPGIPTMKREDLILVLDPKKMPQTQPIAESAWSKTKYPKEFDYNRSTREQMVMNPDFEFETRTRGGDILKEAIKGVLVNEERFKNWPTLLTNLLTQLKEQGLKVRTVPNIQAARQYRAGMRRLPPEVMFGGTVGALLEKQKKEE